MLWVVFWVDSGGVRLLGVDNIEARRVKWGNDCRMGGEEWSGMMGMGRVRCGWV